MRTVERLPLMALENDAISLPTRVLDHGFVDLTCRFRNRESVLTPLILLF